MDSMADVVSSYGQQRADLACLEGRTKMVSAIMGLIIAHREWHKLGTIDELSPAEYERFLDTILAKCEAQVAEASAAVQASARPLV